MYLWVPGSVKDLLVEVETVHADLVLLPFAPGAHLNDEHVVLVHYHVTNAAIRHGLLKKF